MSKTRVLILAGGRSDEHPVSIISARSVLAAIESTSLDATVVVVGRDGRWLDTSESQAALQAGNAPQGRHSLSKNVEIASDFDVVLPLLHGPNGEDGTVQGLLELVGVPYVGSGVLASALCMDKAMSKDVLARHGFSQVPYHLVLASDFSRSPETVLDAVEASLKPPFFVKPANLGSSIGISKAKTREALRTALANASRFDRRLVVEQSVRAARELEVGVIGNEMADASPVGEIRYDAEFYDYETKYTEGMSTLHIPAEIPDSAAQKIQREAVRAFHALDCAGFARVDYFYEPETDQIYLNEVNTIPGFTPFSMFTKLWENAGMSYGEVIERLVSLALERHAAR